MSSKVALGGQRLGSGNKMDVEMHGFQYSTQDLSFAKRTTMSAGTLVPWLVEPLVPGDDADLDIQCEIMTHPTLGPLFGSAKVQLDVFAVPVRLYNSLLHNNAIDIGNNMDVVKLPAITLLARQNTNADGPKFQINPSCTLAYHGIRGVGNNTESATPVPRSFNGLPVLMQWDIYKNYYSNKQEEIGAVIHTPLPVFPPDDPTLVIISSSAPATISKDTYDPKPFNSPAYIEIAWTGLPEQKPQLRDIIISIWDGNNGAKEYALEGISNDVTEPSAGVIRIGTLNVPGAPKTGLDINFWRWVTPNDLRAVQPVVATFPLKNIDKMRRLLLAWDSETTPFEVLHQTPGGVPLTPYSWLKEDANGFSSLMSSQEGLPVKTYQSDIFNNWLRTELIDGPNGINELTKIDVTDGLTQNALLLANKVFMMLNRIAVSDGSYKSWIGALYDEDVFFGTDSPIYLGGLIKELIFQEVISNTASEGQPLGTYAGRGILSNKHKGGRVSYRAKEHTYLFGFISITPRIDYSQGNRWHAYLETMNDWHTPLMDGIGFQDLMAHQAAWWSDTWDDTNDEWRTPSIGKQPAWINYMTNYNETYGNFAIEDNEMFMTFNRRYEYEVGQIKDMTSYIDPAKFNFIFAETALDAQNYWAQIGCKLIIRRKMSAKVMPNL